MASRSDAEHIALMKEVLDGLKVLQLNQTQLASNIDAINGRVNILAGIKEIEDAATIDGKKKNSPVTIPDVDNHESHVHVDISKSPTLTATEAGDTGTPSTISLSNQRSNNATSRIILT